MASTYLTRNPGSAGNRQKWTFSAWVKRASLGASQAMFTAGFGQNNVDTLKFTSTDKINWFSYDGNTDYSIETNRVFRDTNAWYHIQAVLDTANGTTNDRVIIYVNGERETDLATNTMPSQNYNGIFNNNSTAHYIGRYGWNSNEYFDGEMSHVHFSDGYALAPTVFGSTDATTGEWKINTSPTFTLGTNGFTILKDGNTITDQSSNSNNWSLGGGTLTKTEDNPSNVFATMNFLNVPTSNLPTFSNGNTTTVSSTNGSGRFGGSSTLGMVSGKFYIEAKATVDSQYSRNVIGISGDANTLARNNASFFGSDQESSGWYSENGVINYNNSAQYTAATYTTGDIIQIAIDLDNNRLFYGKNGTWQNSGNPTTSTGAITLNGASACNDGAYFICQADDTGTSAVSKFEFNFGNGYFGTTAVSSAGTNASNNGIFEYDVPSGYTALSTKGLNL